MSNLAPLSPEALAEALPSLPRWQREGEALVRKVELEDFRAAMAYLLRVAFVAEAQGHHPEITNVYNRVTLRLTTHDAGDRITDKDVALAHEIDRIGF